MSSTDGARYSCAEEVTNSVTHGIAAALSIAGLSVLVVLASLKGDPWRIVSFSIYGATLVCLYSVSTLYHGIPTRRVKDFFRRLDHAAIYLLIAGTYTPFMLVAVRGGMGWTLFGIVWGLAVFGIALKVAFFPRFEKLSILLYLAMGWVGVVGIKPTLEAITLPGMVLVGLGGLLYTLGVVFYLWERLPFNHAIWHLFVVGASTCHFFAMVFFVLP
ncbi:MAG: hemolysin III family protein [Nitrospiraceae bacterium]|nr:hemolysin III family protein [Nitrospiraceae bacterium]